MKSLHTNKPMPKDAVPKACGECKRPYDDYDAAKAANDIAWEKYNREYGALLNEIQTVEASLEFLSKALADIGPNPNTELATLMMQRSKMVQAYELAVKANAERASRISEVQATLDGHLAAKAVADEEYSAHQRDYEELSRQGEHLELVKTMLGTRGARVIYMEAALATLEHNTNVFLDKLGSPLRVAIKGQREKATGGFSDTIDIKISGPAGVGDEYAALSGGQRRRVDVALLLGLGAIVGNNAESTLFFDEVFDALDADGVTAVCNLVQELAQTRPVVVITHSNMLADRLGGTKIQIGV
jgi:DNA repair exonuclease SbcCD ATPase subunit